LIPTRGWKFFSSSPHPDQALRPTQPPIQWAPGVLSPGIKWLGHEADHSLHSSAKVKNTWNYAFTSPMSSWCGA